MKFSQLPLLLILIHPPLVNAEVYQWVDKNGVTVYSQTPPRSGDARKLTHRSSPIDHAAKQRLQNMRQKVADQQEDRKRLKERQVKESADKKLKMANCKAATNNLTNLIGLGSRRYGGERLTEEQRQKKIAKAQKNMSDNCAK